MGRGEQRASVLFRVKSVCAGALSVGAENGPTGWHRVAELSNVIIKIDVDRGHIVS